MWVLLTCDQKLTNSQFSPTHATNKQKDNGETKTKIFEQYRIYEGSPVDIRQSSW